MISRRSFWSILAALSLSLSFGATGCDSKASAKKDDDEKKKKKKDDDEDEDEESSSKKKKKKKKKDDEDEKAEKSDEKSDKADKKDPDKKADEKPASTDGKLPDLVAIIGTKQDGWAPPAFAKLKGGMTPAEAGKVMAGAENFSEFGFAEIKVTDVPGVVQYELYYAEKENKARELHSAKIQFDPKLKGAALWDALVKQTQEKYGKVKQEDIDKKILTWVGPGFVTAQLTEGLMDDGYTLDVSLPDK
jgi:hypothetical protein